MIGEAISAIGRGIGTFMDWRSRSDDRKRQEHQAAADRQAQYDFAQNGIKWKVADAQASGIHPLYALGAQTSSFSPISIGSGGSTSYGSDLGSMGADVGRAIQATRSAPERVDAFTQSMQAAQLEGAKLDNDIKRASLASSVARLNQQKNPPLPTPGSVPKADEFEDIPRLRGDLGEVNTNARVVNAEDVEKRYGDLAQELWGMYTAASDWLHHAGENTRLRRTGKRGDWWDWVPRIRFNRSHTFKERWKGE